MSLPWNITNPGIVIGGLLTSAEASFVTSLAGLTYADGDILYYDTSELTNLPIGTAGQVLTVSASGLPEWEDASGGGGAGDVVGPASSTNNNIAVFDGTTGKIIKDSGVATSAFAATSHTHTLSQVTDSGALAALNTVSTAQIDNNAATFAKIQDIATSRILGRVSASTGDVESLTAAQVRTLLNVADGATANSGTVTSVAISGTDGIQVDSGSPITSSGTITLGVNASSLRTHLNVEDNADVTNETNVKSALDGMTLTAITSPGSGDRILIQDISDANNLYYVDWDDLPSSGSSSGDVVGPASATNDALARFDGITGKLIQNSNASLDDSGNLDINGQVIAPSFVLEGTMLGSTTLQAESFASGTVTVPSGTATLAVTNNEDFTGTTTTERLDYDRAVGVVSAIGNFGTTETFDWSAATHFTGTLDANITFDFSNAVSGQKITVAALYSGAQRTLAFTPSIKWAGGVAPTGPDTAGQELVMTFIYLGTTYYGSFETFS